MDEATSASVKFSGKEFGGLLESAMTDIRLDEMGFSFQQMYMLKI